MEFDYGESCPPACWSDQHVCISVRSNSQHLQMSALDMLKLPLNIKLKEYQSHTMLEIKNIAILVFNYFIKTFRSMTIHIVSVFTLFFKCTPVILRWTRICSSLLFLLLHQKFVLKKNIQYAYCPSTKTVRYTDTIRYLHIWHI